MNCPFPISACYRPPSACREIFRQLEESMQVIHRESKETILLGGNNYDILPNYMDGDSLSNNLSTLLICILGFHNLFHFQ